MTLSLSEIVLLTTVATLGIACIVTSKITREEREISDTAFSKVLPQNTILIEEID